LAQGWRFIAGSGMVLLDAVYQGALQIEFMQRNSPFQREQSVQVFYK
jgi:hypothetical protein